MGRPNAETSKTLSIRILRAAHEQFITRGFADASMLGIAGQASVTRRTIFHRFPTKTHLLLAVMDEALRSFLAQASGDQAQNDRPRTLEDLRHQCRSLFRLCLSPERVALFRITVAEAGRIEAVSRKLLAFNAALENHLMDAILAVQKGGSIPELPAHPLATELVAILISHPTLLSMMDRSAFADDMAAEFYFNRIWSSFCTRQSWPE